MAFTIANMKKKKQIFRNNQAAPGNQVKGAMLSGGSQPPRNRMEHMAHISTMDRYSPRQNSRKGVEEYSTKKPATNSLSASTRSKGGRLVSASADTKKIGSIGNRMENMFQCRKDSGPAVCCARTISDRFKDPANNSTVMMTKPIET